MSVKITKINDLDNTTNTTARMEVRRSLRAYQDSGFACLFKLFEKDIERQDDRLNCNYSFLVLMY